MIAIKDTLEPWSIMDTRHNGPGVKLVGESFVILRINQELGQKEKNEKMY